MTAALPNAADVRRWAQMFCKPAGQKPIKTPKTPINPELYQWIPQPKWCEREAALLGVPTTRMRRKVRYTSVDGEYKWSKSLFDVWIREDHSVADMPEWKSWAKEVRNPKPEHKKTINRVRELIKRRRGPHTNESIATALGISNAGAKTSTRRLYDLGEIIWDPSQVEIKSSEFRRYIWNHNKKGNAE